MRGFRLGVSMLLILTVLAISSTSWADKKHKHKKYHQGWDDHYDIPERGYPPGWDKGKKTGWRGRDLPPGQVKKYRDRYEHEYDPYYDRRRYEPPMPPEYIPVPIPVLPR